MEEQRKRNVRSKGQMYPLIEEWQGNGQSQQHFCAEKGIAKSVFSYWLKKYKQEEEDTTAEGFAPIQLHESFPSKHGQPYMEVEYSDGVLLRFFQPLSLNFLSTLLDKRKS